MKIRIGCTKIGEIKNEIPRVEYTAANFHLKAKENSAKCVEFPSVRLKGRQEN